MNETEETTLGGRLRSRRLELGLSLEQAAAQTRIRRIFLEALEEDRSEVFPAPAYRTGFLRSYAALLGLDLEALPGGAVAPRPPERPVDAPPPRQGRGGAVRWAAAGGVAVAFLAVALSRPTVEAPPVPEGVAQDSAAAPVSAAEQESAVAQESAAAPESAPAPPVPAAVAAGGSVVRLTATGDTEVSLSMDNHRPQRYALRKDTVLRWEVERSATLRFADPALVAVWLDEAPVDLAGRSELILAPAGTVEQASER